MNFVNYNENLYEVQYYILQEFNKIIQMAKYFIMICFIIFSTYSVLFCCCLITVKKKIIKNVYVD